MAARDAVSDSQLYRRYWPRIFEALMEAVTQARAPRLPSVGRSHHYHLEHMKGFDLSPDFLGLPRVEKVLHNAV